MVECQNCSPFFAHLISPLSPISASREPPSPYKRGTFTARSFFIGRGKLSQRLPPSSFSTLLFLQ